MGIIARKFMSEPELTRSWLVAARFLDRPIGDYSAEEIVDALHALDSVSEFREEWALLQTSPAGYSSWSTENSPGGLLAQIATNEICNALARNTTLIPQKSIGYGDANSYLYLAPVLLDRQLIVTLNFDLSLECAATLLNWALVDVQDKPIRDTIDRWSTSPFAKLHGSINWIRRFNGELVKKHVPTMDGQFEALIGAATKTRNPELRQRLETVRAFLESSHGHAVRVIGYSFSDGHVNDLIADGYRRILIANGREFFESVQRGYCAGLSETARQFLAANAHMITVYPDSAEEGIRRLSGKSIEI